jgi:hypothetical protein
MEKGRGPLKELEWRWRRLNKVRDPMEKGRGPLMRLKERER